jgi:multiple sugar transport system substrate-binding protein
VARFIGIFTLILLAIAPFVAYNVIHTADARDGKVHLTYMAWGNPEQQDTDDAVLKAFEESHPNIKIDFIVAPSSDYPQKIQIMMASGVAPDVFKLDLFYLPKYFPAGYFMPLEDFAKKDSTFSFDDFYPMTKEELTYNGKILGLNTLFGGRIVYYNKKLFKEAGLPDPYEQFQRGEWTYDAFANAARKLTIYENGMAKQFGVKFDFYDMWWVVWGYGGDITDKNHHVYIDDPASIAGMKWYADLLHKDHVMPRPGEDAAGIFSFESGRLGMLVDWQGASPRLRRKINNMFDWDIVPVPRGPAGHYSLMKGNGLIMSSKTRHPAESWEFLKFLNSPETEMAYCGPALRRAIPTRIVEDNPKPGRIDKTKYLSDKWTKNPLNPKSSESPNPPPPPRNTGTFLAIHDTAHRLPVTELWQDWQPDYRNWFGRLNRNEITTEQFCRGLAKYLRDLLGKPKGDPLVTPGKPASNAPAGVRQ